MTAPYMPLPAETAVDVEPFTDDELARWYTYSDDDGPGDVPTVERWSITDTGSAEWAMAKYAAAQAEVEAIDRQAQAHLQRIVDWQNRQTQRQRQSMTFFATHLTEWALRERDETGTKSQVLPSGRVATRETKPKAEVEDEAAVIDWARRLGLSPEELDDVLRVSEKLLVSGLRARVAVYDGKVVDKVSGEVVPGMTVTAASVTADVQPGAM